MSSTFQTLAGGLFDGTQVAPVAINQTGLPAIVRTPPGPVPAGSYDITFANPNPSPTQKVSVKVTAQPLPAGGHNLATSFLWVNPSTLRVTLRIDSTGALADGIFGVEVSRVTTQ